MNSLPVEKSSSIIDEEAMSNRDYMTTNAKIILDARDNELKKINRRLGVIVKETNNVSKLHSSSLDIRSIYPALILKEVEL